MFYGADNQIAKSPLPDLPKLDLAVVETSDWTNRVSRATHIDKKLLVVLDDPRLFNTTNFLPFGIHGDKKALTVAWTTAEDDPADAVANLAPDLWTSFFSSDHGKYPDFTHWRLIPVTKALAGGTPRSSMPPEEIP
ncbi:hypothetical protein H072_8466 [Dactylellina haptotyla CBS 200.50]|uniref:Uncharacterized protein n=1 Tax=Dactylellina haptotyla (strain CBS 200.50) TaxID=1284197 RepID=S8BRR4_DACHA|nr:hypothetical protein H072_8466 [Dactylellina haptotyla CBS 200.50]